MLNNYDMLRKLTLLFHKHYKSVLLQRVTLVISINEINADY